MLRISKLCKSYAGQNLFDDATLQVNSGERVGLVGRNGHGKSTLFRLILREEMPDEGEISVPREYRIGHLAQHMRCTESTVLAEAAAGLRPEAEYEIYRAEEILFGLGFGEADMHRAPSEFSGGFQLRMQLAKVLVGEPDLLLLDEPTNYLDIVSVRWLVRFLRAWPRELMIITHDREVMDSITTHTAIIHRHEMRKIPGDTARLYAQIANEEELHEKTRINEAKERKHIELFVNRFRAQATKAASVQSRIKKLEKMGEKEQLAPIESLDFRFHHAPTHAKNLLEARGLQFGFDAAAPLFSNLSFTLQSTDRIGIIGKNGRGKSTLLRLLAGELTPDAGDLALHPSTQLGYFGQTNIDRLNNALTVEEEIASANLELGRTAVRTLCGIMMFGGDRAEKKVGVLSGGERSRVLLGKILSAPANVLLLDEPTNHLDMSSIEALQDSLREFAGAVMIVTHSEQLLRALATKLIVFQNDGVRHYLHGYEEFLDTVGWDDEQPTRSDAPTPHVTQKVVTPPPVAAAAPTITAADRKVARQQRAELTRQRTEKLTPLKKSMQQLEHDIVRLESELETANAALVTASQEKNVGTFVELSKTVKALQRSIDEHFSRLEIVANEHDAMEKLLAVDEG